jgi:hypothetical protein
MVIFVIMVVHMGTRVVLSVVTNKKAIVTDGTQTSAFQPVVFDGILGS